jgi:hypothetical protein
MKEKWKKIFKPPCAVAEEVDEALKLHLPFPVFVLLGDMFEHWDCETGLRDAWFI